MKRILIIFIILSILFVGCIKVEYDKYSVVEVSKGDTLYQYFYSPDKSKYFTEENSIGTDGMEIYEFYELKYKKLGEVLSREYFFRLEKNLSPVPILWLNNSEALIMAPHSSRSYLYNTDNKSEIEFDYPWSGDKYLFMDKSDNYLVFMVNDVEVNDIYIYNIEYDSWESVHNYKWNGIFENIKVLLSNNMIFFDEPYRDKNNYQSIKRVIKKYSMENNGVIEFMQDAYLLNKSPNDRYITYYKIDKNEDYVGVYDTINDITHILPASIELEWIDNNSFISTSDNNTIIFNSIMHEELQQYHYEVGDYVNSEEELFNLQYRNDEIYFDVVSIEVNDNDYRVGLNKVTTYRLDIEAGIPE